MNSLFGSLAGRHALVTGSTSGIGRAVALEFARAGATVTVHGRTRDRARTVASEIERLGGVAHIEPADVEIAEERARLVHVVCSRLPVDILVNNAGVDLLTTPEAKWPYADKLKKLFDVDVASTLELSKELGGRMRQAGRGVILNIGWDQADRGMEGDSGELFSAAKNAIMGFTRSLALSLAPQVRVNCIAPGWIRTQWGDAANDVWQQRVLRETPLGRWGTPEDIARLARFLCSPDADYLTGQVINANGGAVR